MRIALVVFGITSLVTGACSRADESPRVTGAVSSGPGASTTARGACDYVVEGQMRPLLGTRLTVVEGERSAECYVFEGDVDPARLTNYTLTDYNFLKLRLITRDHWEREKTPNPSLDRPLSGLGDEAYELMTGSCGQMFTLRRGDLGFHLSGCISRRENSPQRPVETWTRQFADCLAHGEACLVPARTVRHLVHPPLPPGTVRPKAHMEVFAEAFTGANRRGKTLRPAVVAWLEGRGCCFRDDMSGRSIAARCPQPQDAAQKGMLVELEFDDADRLQGMNVQTDYRGAADGSPCQP